MVLQHQDNEGTSPRKPAEDADMASFFETKDVEKDVQELSYLPPQDFDVKPCDQRWPTSLLLYLQMTVLWTIDYPRTTPLFWHHPR